MARGWTWGEMVRARLGAETLPTADQLALRRRVAAASILGLALGAGLQCAWPSLVPAIGGFLEVSALLLLRVITVLVVTALLGLCLARVSAFLSQPWSARHG